MSVRHLPGQYSHKGLYFGDAGGTSGGDVEIDYLRWHTRGAYAPVLPDACRYLPGLLADPVEPNAETLEQFWWHYDHTSRRLPPLCA